MDWWRGVEGEITQGGPCGMEQTYSQSMEDGWNIEILMENQWDFIKHPWNIDGGNILMENPWDCLMEVIDFPVPCYAMWRA